jgi:hypothetical protein
MKATGALSRCARSFPPTWPVFTPAVKLGDWLESYAHALELNVWTSSEVTSIEQARRSSLASLPTR